MGLKHTNRNNSFRFNLPLLVFVIAATLFSAEAFAAAKRSCETLFSSETAIVETTARKSATSASSSASSASTAPTVKKTTDTSMGVTEMVTDIYTGSPLYSVVLGETNKPNSEGHLPGLYKRDKRTWKLLIPGEISLSPQGGPYIEQLSLAEITKENYVVTFVDGQVYLFTNHSDLGKPDTFIHFGTKTSPLFEVGSMQKRFLDNVGHASRVSVFQDPVLTQKKSQLVMVSMKFARRQAVGEGVTFAFEVMQTKQGLIQLNGKPVVLDYEFHDSAKLGEMRTSGASGKILFSKILLEQFENADLTDFATHVDHVESWVKKVVSNAMSAVSPSLFLQSSGQRVAYNITDARVEKNVLFKREMFSSQATNLIVEQHYDVARGQSEIMIKVAGVELFKIPGQLDSLKDKSPAIWLGQNLNEAIISRDGTLFMVFQRKNSDGAKTTRAARPEEIGLVELGTMQALFPSVVGNGQSTAAIDFITHLQGVGESTDRVIPIEKGVVVLSAKIANGAEFTGAIQFKLLMQQTILKDEAFPLAKGKFSGTELVERLKIQKKNDEAVFDTITPRATSSAAYEQIYDPSKPHVNLMASSLRRLVFNFQQPNKIMTIAQKLHFAEFTETAGVENPSGLYVNILAEKITGNESTRSIGELLPRPNAAVDPDHPERQYFFANIETYLKQNDLKDELDDESAYKQAQIPAYKLRLFGIDASRQHGAQGYKLVLAVENAKSDVSLHKIEIGRANWLASLRYFRDATFIQGRNKDREFAYLFLSYATMGDQPNYKTYVFRINMARPDDSLRPMVLDSLYTTKELQQLVGYDEDGFPTVMLTPDLNPEARQFAVYDLRKGAREFPNQSNGPKRKFKFGDVRTGTATREESFVSVEDSWQATAAEIRKDNILGRSNELAQFDSFAALGKRLDDLSSAKNTPERMILVVPESLRELVWDYILTKGFGVEKNPTNKAFDPSKVVNKFSHLNHKLTINVITREKLDQSQYLANTESWAKARAARPDDRIITLGRLDKMSSTTDGDFPINHSQGGSTFQFSYTHADPYSEGEVGQSGVDSTMMNPSSLYLLAAEKPMQLKEFRENSKPPSSSIVLIATPEEMKRLETEVEHEVENGLLERYLIQEIKDPDQDSMAISLGNIFANDKVRELEYQFSAKEIQPNARLSSEQSYSVVIDYAISRFMALVESKKDSRFESFMRFRSAFAQAVLADKEARKSRLLNKAFVERVMTQVFDIPTNLVNLPPDDPMVILNRSDAALKLQQAGYTGPFDLKEKVIRRILSQTQAEAGKTIPSSVILYGDTGSGKTHLFISLIKMLKLKMYDFSPHATNNEDAQAIYINVGKLKDKNGANREGDMDVGQALDHLNKLIATPNGHRTWVLFDDVHASSAEVTAKIVSWQRSIFESQDGMYVFEGPNGVVRRPVRNLVMFMTVNPTTDHDQIGKYSREKGKPTVEEILIATLSTPNQKIETSFLRRWGLLLNLDRLPAGAKGPELIKKFGENAVSRLNSMHQIVMVDPYLVRQVVEQGTNIDARSFLDAATNSLMAASNNVKGSLVLVKPSMTRQPPKYSPYGSGENDPSERLSSWISQNTQALSLDQSLDGNLAFTKLIVDAFRMPLYESLTLALQEDVRFLGTDSGKNGINSAVQAAIYDHLTIHTYVSLRDMNLMASSYGLNTQSEREVFKTALAKQIVASAPNLLPKGFKTLHTATSTWKNVLGTSSLEHGRDRRQVLSELVLKNNDILRQRLGTILRLSDIDQIAHVDPVQWLNGLNTSANPDSKIVGKQLADALWDFLPQIVSLELAENRMTDVMPISIYVATRLYLHAVDSAIIHLDWVPTTKFLLKALHRITEDQVLSQKAGVQNFLFKDPHRLIKPTIPDYIFQIISSTQAIERLSQEARARNLMDFDSNVEKYISPLAPTKAE